jgi:hypothetical protein
MACLFAILSTPVCLREGAFAVVIGTIAGIEVKQFATLREARNHYRLLVTCLRMAVEAPLELVIIDGETEYLSLREKFDKEYEQRVHVHPSASVPSPAPHTLFRKVITRLSGLLT